MKRRTKVIVIGLLSLALILICTAIVIAITNNMAIYKTINNTNGTASKYSFNSDNYEAKSYSSSFTNKYGTSTTKCAHIGCANYIASSGDTNCCTYHSRRCLSCSCYIDEDATYCMSCIKKAF